MTLQTIRITSTDPQIELERRIDSIIKLLFRLYFNTFLKNLTKKNLIILDNQLLHSYLIKIYYI